MEAAHLVRPRFTAEMNLWKGHLSSSIGARAGEKKRERSSAATRQRQRNDKFTPYRLL